MSWLSAVLILPTHLRDAGNQLAIALGHDVPPGNTYVEPLYPTGSGDEPTHYGCHAWVSDDFRATIEAAKQGSYPVGLESAAPVVDALIASFSEPSSSSDGHFETVAAANGLERRN